jgi:hypothetical protein
MFALTTNSWWKLWTLTVSTEIERQHIIIIRINMSKWKRETNSTQQIHRVSLVLMTGKINNTTQLISQHTKNIQAWYGHFNNNMERINNGQFPSFLLNLSGHGSTFHVWVKCQNRVVLFIFPVINTRDTRCICWVEIVSLFHFDMLIRIMIICCLSISVLCFK